MEKLDSLAAGHIAELNKRAIETDLRLKWLYDAIEGGVAIWPARR